jgi:hypothetical protein
MNINALKYSTENRTHATMIMGTIRDCVLLPEDALKGSRFTNDDHVMWVLESQTKEDEFIQDPVFHVCQALVESAKSDHWYAHVKDWGPYEWEDHDYMDDEDCMVEE